jgi:hypothetical protein
MAGFKRDPSEGNPPTLTFGIPYLRNPRSIASSDPFNVTIFDESGKAMYELNTTNITAPTITMEGA